MRRRKTPPPRKPVRAPRGVSDALDSGAPEAILRPQRSGSSDMERAVPHPAISEETGAHGAGDEPGVTGFLEPPTPGAGAR